MVSRLEGGGCRPGPRPTARTAPGCGLAGVCCGRGHTIRTPVRQAGGKSLFPGTIVLETGSYHVISTVGAPPSIRHSMVSAAPWYCSPRTTIPVELTARGRRQLISWMAPRVCKTEREGERWEEFESTNEHTGQHGLCSHIRIVVPQPQVPIEHSLEEAARRRQEVGGGPVALAEVRRQRAFHPLQLTTTQGG